MRVESVFIVRAISLWLTGFLLIAVLFGLYPCHAADSARILALKRASTLRARIHGETGHWDLALRELDTLSRHFPDDRFIQSDLATACRRTGDFRRAEKIYRNLMEMNPDVRTYSLDLAYLMAELGRFSEVISLLDSRWKITPGVDREVVLLLAEANDRAGSQTRATELYLFLLKQNPDDLPVLLALGERYLRAGERDRSREAFTKVIGLDPQELRAYKGMASTYADLDPDSYRLWLMKGYKITETDWEISYLLGEYFAGRNDQRHLRYHQETLDRLVRASDSDTSIAGRTRARCLWRLGKKREAEDLFRKMVSSLAMKGSGAAETGSGDAVIVSSGAAANGSGSAQISETTIELANDLAELLTEEKRYDEALKVLDTVLGAAGKDTFTGRGK
ncbi:MAG: hypothetical protein CVV64_13290 [Candidatus Wallbacteria bacterium HGW-Wallbacteria-1]|jgi:tetratricopeptide (TPR) repeat protein|uniref:Tetratricopeptide repeat protein n=1 Tax=Candidatus Wallbacteria bacterium HGW-Wallbacteria-1 TaxID=2013854 RepID=A0A2N1PMS6_9BACT|nr:MAG: hypothetical protein CVV64_13290 [Candidatus Wallbacteria bacterium HGW-Wallbacteria-1]